MGLSSSAWSYSLKKGFIFKVLPLWRCVTQHWIETDCVVAWMWNPSATELSKCYTEPMGTGAITDAAGSFYFSLSSSPLKRVQISLLISFPPSLSVPKVGTEIFNNEPINYFNGYRVIMLCYYVFRWLQLLIYRHFSAWWPLLKTCVTFNKEKKIIKKKKDKEIREKKY